jgi:hypothetical protein
VQALVAGTRRTIVKYHKGRDGWGRDSFAIPEYAIAGVSCTGDDGPAPRVTAEKELTDMRDFLKAQGFTRMRFKATPSGNCCMVKVWLVVAGKDYKRALPLAGEYLIGHQYDTRLLHDAT